MTRNKLIISTVTVVTAFAVLCTAGASLALSVTQNRSNGSISTADLKLSAKAANVEVYSAVRASADESGVFGNDEIGYYKYEQSAVQGTDKISFPSHEGAVEYTDKSISIQNIMPGDKVEFDIEVTSESTVSFNYRAELYVDASEGQTLLDQLEFEADGLGLLRPDVSESESNNDLAPAVLTDYTEWTTFSSNDKNIENVHVTIELPIERTEGQGESVSFYYVVGGIQNTVSQEDVVRFETEGGGAIGFKTVKEGVEYAYEQGITEIPVVGSTVLEEGEVVIDNYLKFVGVADEEGNYPVLRGVRFVIENSAAAAFEHVNFAGASYIDVSRATVLNLDGCNAHVEPVDYFDTVKREHLTDSAFIVSSSTLTPIRLTLTDNNFTSGFGAAINLRSPLGNGTLISGNGFGSEESVYGGSAVVKFSGASDDSVISVKGNSFYGKRAMSLGGDYPYLVISQNNIAYGITDGIFVGGGKGAAFVDSGSKIGENSLQCANIANGELAFGGVDVSLNNIDRITAGKIALSENNINIAGFYNKYVVGSTLAHNAIGLYKDGALYAYLNASAEAEEGFTVDIIG